jgi:Flp pilus assembly protein TadD
MLVLLDSSASLLKKGDITGAIAQRREAIALDPAFAEAHYDLGVALSEADASSAEAEAAFRRAIALDPDYARAYAALGRLLEARGDAAGARAARARTAALTPCS